MRPYARLVAPGPLIDIGVNIAHRDVSAGREEMLRNAYEAGVVACVCTGTSEKASKQVVAVCEGNRSAVKLYATVGVHPHDAKSFTASTVEELRKLAKANKSVRAIGECGIDFDRMFSTPDEQKHAFTQQLRLARELELPVFLHQRLGFNEFCAIMDAEWPAAMAHKAVVHCFTGNASELKQLVSRGYMIGLTGLTCDQQRGSATRKALSQGLLPLDRLMLETDAPFCSPKCIPNVPRRCEVEMMSYIAQDIAALMKVSFEDICHATTMNAKLFFGLPGGGDSTVAPPRPVVTALPTGPPAELQTTTALAFCVNPSLPVYERINAIRNGRDHAYPRWMPHVNLFFPFVAESLFPAYRARLEAAGLASFGELELHFDHVHHFAQRDRVTFHLATSKETTEKLTLLFQRLRDAMPEVMTKHPVFTPHLTLAQCGKTQVEHTQRELTEWLGGQGIRISMDHISLISRSGRDPFRVVERVYLVPRPREGIDNNNNNNNNNVAMPLPVANTTAAKPTTKPCRFYGTPTGCRRGRECQFRHE